jgi:hypothetical protein
LAQPGHHHTQQQQAAGSNNTPQSSCLAKNQLQTMTPHLWPAQLWVNELVALDQGDAQLCGHNTPTSTDLQHSSRVGVPARQAQGLRQP